MYDWLLALVDNVNNAIVVSDNYKDSFHQLDISRTESSKWNKSSGLLALIPVGGDVEMRTRFPTARID